MPGLFDARICWSGRHPVSIFCVFVCSYPVFRFWQICCARARSLDFGRFVVLLPGLWILADLCGPAWSLDFGRLLCAPARSFDFGRCFVFLPGLSILADCCAPARSVDFGRFLCSCLVSRFWQICCAPARSLDFGR